MHRTLRNSILFSLGRRISMQSNEPRWHERGEKIKNSRQRETASFHSTPKAIKSSSNEILSASVSHELQSSIWKSDTGCLLSLTRSKFPIKVTRRHDSANSEKSLLIAFRLEPVSSNSITGMTAKSLPTAVTSITLIVWRNGASEVLQKIF